MTDPQHGTRALSRETATRGSRSQAPAPEPRCCALRPCAGASRARAAAARAPFENADRPVRATCFCLKHRGERAQRQARRLRIDRSLPGPKSRGSRNDVWRQRHAPASSFASAPSREQSRCRSARSQEPQAPSRMRGEGPIRPQRPSPSPKLFGKRSAALEGPTRSQY
eukprot:Amastigsp_a4025_33.p1 type:complete len:168 gc:universal Amastigsp_a4025_33:89-592(+)